MTNIYKETVVDQVIDEGMGFYEIESNFEKPNRPYSMSSDAFKALVKNLQGHNSQELQDEMYPPSMIEELTEKGMDNSIEYNVKFFTHTKPTELEPILILYRKFTPTNSPIGSKNVFLIEGYYQYDEKNERGLWFNYKGESIKTEDANFSKNEIIGWTYIN